MSTSLFIAIASAGNIRVETMLSVISGMINLAEAGLPPNIFTQLGGYKDVNCNVLVDKAIEMKATHIMFIDTDMTFPGEAILKLLADDKDIVGGDYNVRLDPLSPDRSGPTTKMLVDGKPVSMLRQDFPTELFKCYSLPLGFMLVKTEIFKKLKKPYFESTQKDGVHTTEDVDFCIKANNAGIEVWCDPTIKIGHIGSYLY